ncbi:leucine-rich repeat domain-containing protein, partial [Aquimarina macrocephali]|uniref:leucine-rich repeat domain-containing protein n=1 Tax=Aquimarina macrocephali TaxID=666563 RepID=UPI0004658464
AKQITSFVFLLTNNPINVNVVAIIDEENKTITASMPIDTDITGLLPEIKTSALTTITPDTAKDFTNPVEYVVIAEDGSEVIYTVTINVLLSQRQILQAILDANPQNSLGWDLENTPNLNDLSRVTTNSSGSITDLLLGFGNITIIPSVIGQLTSIRSLDLSGNGIAELPPEIGFLKQLSVLSLSLNPIRVLPSEIGQLIKLEEVVCQQTGLNSIPVEIGLLTSLKKLNLSSNNLTSIPVELAQLGSLEVLSFNDNKLTSIPVEIGQLNKLSSLKLYGNQLTAIPSEIGALTNLGELFLSDNQLTSVPAEIGFLNVLSFLDIQNNNLTTIPQSIYNRISVMDLYLDVVVVPETASQKDALISIYSANPGNTLGWGVDNFPEVGFDANGNPKTITI